MMNKIYKENAIVVPATMLDTTEVFSEVYHSNAQTGIEAFIYVADTSKTATSLVLTVYGSTDGTTFYAMDTETIVNGVGSASGVAISLLAPYAKLGLKSNGALTAAHGTIIHAMALETYMENQRDYDTVEIPVADPTAASVTIEVPNFFERVSIKFLSTGSEITNNSFSYTVSTSADGVTWFDISVVTGKDAADFATDILLDNEGLLKYVKLTGVALVGAGSKVQAFLGGVGY